MHRGTRKRWSLKDDPEVKLEREKLEKRARETMKEPELSKYLENMKRFEKRTAALEKEYQKRFEAKGTKPEEAAKEAEKKAHEQVEQTYQNMERLLKEGDAKIPMPDRTLLAQQSMEHYADTASISQGRHGSCFAASVESRTYTKDPAEATRLLADVATTGKYTSKGKPPVEVDMTKDEFSLKRQSDSLDVPRPDGRRDYASQLFQVTTGNVALQIENSRTVPKGRLRYEQHPRDTPRVQAEDNPGSGILGRFLFDRRIPLLRRGWILLLAHH